MRRCLLKSLLLVTLAVVFGFGIAWAQERGVRPTGVTRIVTIAGGTYTSGIIPVGGTASLCFMSCSSGEVKAATSARGQAYP